jgi:hypothetical protein
MTSPGMPECLEHDPVGPYARPRRRCPSWSAAWSRAWSLSLSLPLRWHFAAMCAYPRSPSSPFTYAPQAAPGPQVRLAPHWWGRAVPNAPATPP